MISNEIITVCFEDYRKHTNAICGQNPEFVTCCYVLLPKSFYTSKSIIYFSKSLTAFIFMTPFSGNYGKCPC